MARSPEYPDLAWVPPKSWTNANRTSVQVVVIHTTEGSEHGQSAEDGAAYDARRTDGTSTHYFHDSNSTVQSVRTEDKAHTARANGNRIGIHHELCGDAGDSAAEWADGYHSAMLEQAARQVARDCKKWDIPVRRLSPAQVRNGVKGICGHVDITEAFPADRGTHTDPGRNFPWALFLAKVDAYLNPERAQEEDDMITREDIAAGVAYFFAEAARAARGEAPADTSADQFARNARRSVDALFDFSAAAPRSDAEGGDATMAALTRLDATTQAIVARLNALPPAAAR